MLKYSKQRESIRTYLDEHRTHPTAETVYSDIKQEFPSISLGTVYRNLNLLADRGDILRISTGFGPDHFDGNNLPHYHFLCEKCGKVMDIDIDLETSIIEQANQQFDGIVHRYVTQFYGLCPECNTKTN